MALNATTQSPGSGAFATSNQSQQSTIGGSPLNKSFPQIGGPTMPQQPSASNGGQFFGQPPTNPPTLQSNQSSTSLPALRPVFGVPLDDLLKRDGSAVPLVVYQCIQAVDLFGLEVEGIYRLSGSSTSVNKLKNVFDNGKNPPHASSICSDRIPDSDQVDFRNPEAFYHDVNSVAGLLKQFFRDLPDPLLTREHYQGFIDAARKYQYSSAHGS